MGSSENAMKRIISGEFINDPAIPDDECISGVVNVVEDTVLAKDADMQPVPRWAWRLLYAHVFKEKSLLTPEEAAKRFCKGLLRFQLGKQSHPCVSLGVETGELFPDYPEYKNIKIVAHIRGTKLEVPRIENINSMSYAIYADNNTITYLHGYISSGAYKALDGERYTK